MTEQSIRLLQTSEHRCGYFSDRHARNLLIDPTADQQRQLYDLTVNAGFRRSGELIYRPRCRHCSACQATRVRVDQFAPSRSQRRCLRRNDDMQLSVSPAAWSEEVFDLYSRYLGARHSGGGMDEPSRSDFEQFLLSKWSDSLMLIAHLEGDVVGVAITDRLASGLSAVYSFFEPELDTRGIGNWLILKQIQLTRELTLPYLYLGYWIRGHAKMDYKVKFRPIEVLSEGRWDTYEPTV